MGTLLCDRELLLTTAMGHAKESFIVRASENYYYCLPEQNTAPKMPLFHAPPPLPPYTTVLNLCRSHRFELIYLTGACDFEQTTENAVRAI